ncbi:ANTAR domain-containing protein [Bacillota bacterium LX-D]|nr:ANTAR domain-containing protein [Bacillota bacterium LX-D]
MISGSVLVVCGKAEYGDEIAALMLHQGFSSAESALSANEARRKLNSLEPDLLIVNTPLPDEQGKDFILDIAEKTDAGILVLAKHEYLDEMQDELEKVGALILPKPISRIILAQTARFADNMRKSIIGLKNQRDDLQKKMDERKVIEKAKWLLVEKLSMTEPQANRYIQKRAMDLRLSQFKVAREIVHNYE